MEEKFSILSFIVKFVLIILLIFSLQNHLWHIASTTIFLILLLLAPSIIKLQTKIKFPKEFELLLLFFVIAVFILSKFKNGIAPLLFGLGVGLIGLLISYILYASNQIKRNPFLILLFSFNFAIAFGTAIELVKYYLRQILSYEPNVAIYSYTMHNLTYVLIGATLSIVFGYLYMKARFKLFTNLLKKFRKMNPDILTKTESIEEIIAEIKLGESSTQEFKSTLRTNLHTKEHDKNIENSVLKTIAAFMNTKGGILFIGVTDDKKILGIEKDNFENADKFSLHLMNIIKQKIGKKNLNLIDSKLVKIKDRHIARLEIRPSRKPVFLKEGKEELFYIRTGPQTIELKGSELIDYVEKRFKK